MGYFHTSLIQIIYSTQNTLQCAKTSWWIQWSSFVISWSRQILRWNVKSPECLSENFSKLFSSRDNIVVVVIMTITPLIFADDVILFFICSNFTRFLHRKIETEIPKRTYYGSDSFTEFEDFGYRAKKLNKVTKLLLMFGKREWEWPFLSQADLLLKYSVLMSCIVLATIFVIQMLNKS